jgi:hypothetical protein
MITKEQAQFLLEVLSHPQITVPLNVAQLALDTRAALITIINTATEDEPVPTP